MQISFDFVALINYPNIFLDFSILIQFLFFELNSQRLKMG